MGGQQTKKKAECEAKRKKNLLRIIKNKQACKHTNTVAVKSHHHHLYIGIKKKNEMQWKASQLFHSRYTFFSVVDAAVVAMDCVSVEYVFEDFLNFVCIEIYYQ